MSFFEIGNLIFDFEDGIENGGSDKVDFVGNLGKLFESIKHSGGYRGKISRLATGDVAPADLDGGGGLTGGLTLGFGFLYDLAVGFGDAEFVHEEFDALWNLGGDGAFFEVDHGAIVAADDFILGGFLDGFVVGDALADDVDAHVGGGVIDSFAGDAMEDFFEDWEGLEIAVVVDNGFAVFVEVEMVDHVDVAEVGSGGLVGNVDGVLEWQRPDREGLKLGITSIDALLVLVVELRERRGEFARAGTWGGDDH